MKGYITSDCINFKKAKKVKQIEGEQGFNSERYRLCDKCGKESKWFIVLGDKDYGINHWWLCNKHALKLLLMYVKEVNGYPQHETPDAWFRLSAKSDQA